jgi:hypothetical protein
MGSGLSTGTTLDEPKSYRAIMVSSTFTDIESHRQQVIQAIHDHGYRANVMEHDGARADADVIDASLRMVRDSAAYVGVITHKYGQTPFCPDRNPNRLSITELEFNEAMLRGRPILLFIMGERHVVTKVDIETDPDKLKKLDAFRERAKRMREGGEVERVYEVFDSLEQFSTAGATAIGRLARYLSPETGEIVGATDRPEDEAALPRPPNLAALPRYLGSHSFVGRASELQTLTDWCGAADPNPLLLFEAIGGSGKSMLTWEWLTNHAAAARGDWAGRFWYSFYEKGAVMAAFCRQALAYMTMRPPEEYAKLRMPDLSDRLVAEVEKRPWLIVLDGLERVLVAYHRHDAAQLRDEEADMAVDQIATRDPCAAIRAEDDDLLRRLAAAAPSKILVSSRLMPLALVNRSNVRVPGVRHEILPGLRPADAEAMIRACGVFGQSQAIQAYLQTNCDCHPLVIGVLAGLINTYPPDRGNFNRWAADPHHGGALNLAELDLVQRRNHILLAAIGALAPASRQMLQTLALLQSGADFATLQALNPHLPPEPDEVPEPEDPARGFRWSYWDEERRAREKSAYEETLARREAYLDALSQWKSDIAERAAPVRLGETLRDLERRGLLQYDRGGRRYDLHPVVRGVAAGRMEAEETTKLGQMVVDHFTRQPHNPWEQAETLEDVAAGLHVVRVLVRMGQYQGAFDAYRGELAGALYVNLGARAEMQALLKPFFPNGWDREPVQLDEDDLGYLLNDAAISLDNDYPEQAKKLYEQNIVLGIKQSTIIYLCSYILNLGSVTNSLVMNINLSSLARDISEAVADNDYVFGAKLHLFRLSILQGDRETADGLWRELDGMSRPRNRAVYRLGDLERYRTADLFYRGELTEKFLVEAERLARDGHNRDAIEEFYRLRGEWCLANKNAASAVENFGELVRMRREVGNDASYAEARLALARLRAGMDVNARGEAERLSKATGGAALAVAELWHELGERDAAVEHALRAHSSAVGDGEPYVYRYYLDRTRALLAELGATLPEVPRYDPSTATPYPWEKDIRALAEKHRAERLRAKKAKKPRSRRKRGATVT